MTLFKSLREFLGIQENGLCMVISEQEGAEIWLNGVKTSFSTPKLVAIPLKSETKVTLKLTGHEDHTAWVRSQHKLSYYHCSLKRIPLRLIKNEKTDYLSF